MKAGRHCDICARAHIPTAARCNRCIAECMNALKARCHQLNKVIVAKRTGATSSAVAKAKAKAKAQPQFGEVGGKAVRCKHRMTPEMVDVKNKRCLCRKSQPRFGEVGGKPVCCKRCKRPEMVDVVCKRCLCGKGQPSFGEAGCMTVCCKQCKTPEMIRLKNKRCRQTSHERNGPGCRQETT